MPQNLWNETEAQKRPELGGLVYRSNLLGSDRAVVNIYGGNTSAKLTAKNHLGQDVEVLWVKGSGSDVATITRAGLSMSMSSPMRLFSSSYCAPAAGVVINVNADSTAVLIWSSCFTAISRPTARRWPAPDQTSASTRAGSGRHPTRPESDAA